MQVQLSILLSNIVYTNVYTIKIFKYNQPFGGLTRGVLRDLSMPHPCLKLGFALVFT